MINALDLSCPNGHPIVVLLFKPESVTAADASLMLVKLHHDKVFSDICHRCGKQAKTGHFWQTSAATWAEVPGIRASEDVPIVLVIRGGSEPTTVVELTVT